MMRGNSGRSSFSTWPLVVTVRVSPTVTAIIGIGSDTELGADWITVGHRTARHLGLEMSVNKPMCGCLTLVTATTMACQVPDGSLRMICREAHVSERLLSMNGKFYLTG